MEGSLSVQEHTKMQGTLWKWTNYLSGWQPRWFVLETGILSYYLSPSEVHLGSRGSLKVISCDISVHHSDHHRMDIVMPSGIHLYLRAASTAERQQWVVALGSAKQGDGTVKPGNSHKVRTDALRAKMTQLHTNCQLLVSQIADIKAAASLSHPDTDNLTQLSSSVSATCDTFLNVLHECMDLSLSPGSQLSTLKPLTIVPGDNARGSRGNSPVVKKSLNSFSEEELYRSPTTPGLDPTFPSLSKHSPPLHHKKTTPIHSTKSLPSHVISGSSHVISSSQRSVSFETPKRQSSLDGTGTRHETDSYSHASNGTREDSQATMSGSNSNKPLSSHLIPRTDSKTTDKTHRRTNSDLFLTPVSSPHSTPPPSPRQEREAESLTRIGDRIHHRLNQREVDGEERKVETFFSKAPQKFEDLVLVDGERIPTAEFLDCCRAVVPFFDTLNATAFAPVKADINGNIEKLTKKYQQNPALYSTLQAIVEHELETSTHNAKNSATDALLWLKRAMEFIQQFIAEVAAGEHCLDVAAGKAYSKSLRMYHNWIVKGIFSLAMKAVPYHKDFLAVMGSGRTEDGETQVTQDMAHFARCLGEIVDLLNTFYKKHDLDPPV